MTTWMRQANALLNKKRAVETARFFAQQVDDDQSTALFIAND